MTWQWVVSQIFAFIGLVFVVISYQQKESTKLLLSPTNVIIEIIGLTSAIIGIIRLDIKKKEK